MNVEHEVTLLVDEIRRLGSKSKSCTIFESCTIFKSETTSENASFCLFSITNYIITNLCETLNRKFTLILKCLSIWCLLFALMSAAWSSDPLYVCLCDQCHKFAYWFGGLDIMLKLKHWNRSCTVDSEIPMSRNFCSVVILGAHVVYVSQHTNAGVIVVFGFPNDSNQADNFSCCSLFFWDLLTLILYVSVL